MEFDRPIAIVITLFIVLISIFFLAAPKYQEFKILQQKLGEKQAEYDAKFAYYSEIAKVYEKIMANKELVDKIDSAIPSNVSYGPLVYFFQKKGFENGLILKGLYLTKASSKDQKSDIKEIVFSLSLLGEYSSFKNFMYSLERSARLFEINSASFGTSVQPGTKENAEPAPVQILQTYSFQMEIKTYSY